jgi:hypothetical protein
VTVGPKGLHEWGPNRSTLARLDFDEAGKVLTNELIRPPEADRAIWLPSLERGTKESAALLYTCGTVASRGMKGANNINSVETEVVLEWNVKN